MKNITTWLSLNQNKLYKARQEKIRGVEVETFVSPYDVPEAVGVWRKPNNKRLVIEFKYIAAEEPWDSFAPKQTITLMLGKHSRRLYRVEFDESVLKPPSDRQALLRELTLALESLPQQSPSVAAREGNYEVAKEVLAERKEELINSLCALS